jgi:hypothetical protein
MVEDEVGEACGTKGGRREMRAGFWCGNLMSGRGWINLAEDGDKVLALVNTVINLRF